MFTSVDVIRKIYYLQMHKFCRTQYKCSITHYVISFIISYISNVYFLDRFKYSDINFYVMQCYQQKK